MRLHFACRAGIVVVLSLLFLSACDRTFLECRGGANQKTDCGVGLRL